MNKNGSKKLGCVVPKGLVAYLKGLAKTETISTGHTVSVSRLIRRALVERYGYEDNSISIENNSVSVQRNSQAVQEAVSGLSRLSR